MRIREWFDNLIHHDEESEGVDTEAKLTEAREALQASDTQLEKAREIRQDSNRVGQHARFLNRQNHFAARVRRAMEGR